jgi:hypothetical protein
LVEQIRIAEEMSRLEEEEFRRAETEDMEMMARVMAESVQEFQRSQSE